MWSITSLLRPFWSPLSFLYRNLAAFSLPTKQNHALEQATPQPDQKTAQTQTEPQTEPPPPADLNQNGPKIMKFIPIVPGKQKPQLEHDQVAWYPKGKLKGWGGTAIIEQMPSGNIIKSPNPDPYCLAEEQEHCNNLRLEASIYRAIGDHPRLPKMLGWNDLLCCLEMEYLENGDLRSYLQKKEEKEKESGEVEEIALELRQKWCMQTAEAVAVLHEHQVVHCDLSPRNFLLDSELNIKISDFGGSSFRGGRPSAIPGTRFRHHSYDIDAVPTVQDEVFALGSLIYFILEGVYPLKDLSSEDFDRAYEAEQFPDTSLLVYGHVVRQCWKREIHSAQAVYQALIRRHSIT